MRQPLPNNRMVLFWIKELHRRRRVSPKLAPETAAQKKSCPIRIALGASFGETRLRSPQHQMPQHFAVINSQARVVPGFTANVTISRCLLGYFHKSSAPYLHIVRGVCQRPHKTNTPKAHSVTQTRITNSTAHGGISLHMGRSTDRSVQVVSADRTAADSTDHSTAPVRSTLLVHSMAPGRLVRSS